MTKVAVITAQGCEEGETLTKGVDYTLTWSDGCRAPGAYTVTVTGIGDYTGEAVQSFTIGKQPLDAANVTLSWTESPYSVALPN